MNEWQFGTRANGDIVSAYEIRSASGFKAVILNVGATLQSFRLPNGQNMTLGFESWEGYEADKNYIGRFIGPNANRIVGSRFQIDETRYALLANDGAHNLHSGPKGFDTQIWAVERAETGLVLRHNSPHGYNGFPGLVKAILKITLLQNTLRLDMQAETDRPTPLNLTWHPYWNLGRNNRIDGHELQINASSRTDLETYSSESVKDTRYDFRAPLPLGGVQLDTNYKDVASATLHSRQTSMTVTSSLPDMQIYTGDSLTHPRAGIAIEPQFRPNDINFAQYSLLRPGEIYKHWIEYHFETGD